MKLDLYFFCCKTRTKKMLRGPRNSLGDVHFRPAICYCTWFRASTPTFVPQSLPLFLNSCFCSSSSLIWSDDMVYIAPMRVVDTWPIFFRWCSYTSMAINTKMCQSSLKKTALTVINIWKIEKIHAMVYYCLYLLMKTEKDKLYFLSLSGPRESESIKRA